MSLEPYQLCALYDEFVKIADATSRAIARGVITPEEVAQRTGADSSIYRPSSTKISPHGVAKLNRVSAEAPAGQAVGARANAVTDMYLRGGEAAEGARQLELSDWRKRVRKQQPGMADPLAARANPSQSVVGGADRYTHGEFMKQPAPKLPTEVAGGGRGVVSPRAAPAAAKAEGGLLASAGKLMPKTTGGKLLAGAGGLAALGGLAYGAHRLMNRPAPSPQQQM